MKRDDSNQGSISSHQWSRVYRSYLGHNLASQSPALVERSERKIREPRSPLRLA